MGMNEEARELSADERRAAEPPGKAVHDPRIEQLRQQLGPIYGDYRSALLNRKYYAYKLNALKRYNTTYEIIQAIITSSAIGAWAIWQQEGGRVIWTLIAAVATVMAAIKPALQIPKRVEELNAQYLGYNHLYYKLMDVIRSVPLTGGISREMEKTLEYTAAQFERLDRMILSSSNKRILRRCESEVNQEIPPKSLWNPDLAYIEAIRHSRH